MRHTTTLMIAAIVLLAPLSVQSQEETALGGRINQSKVLSDKIDDVTTIENIVKSFVKPGMSDQEKAKRPLDGRGQVSPSDGASERVPGGRLGGP